MVYAVCFNNPDIVESLLENHKADPDIPDSIVNYTPIMWAVHLNYLNIVQLLLTTKQTLFVTEDDGKNASTLVFPENTEMYEYFRSHNLLKLMPTIVKTFIKQFFLPQDDYEDDLSTKLKMHTITSNTIGNENEKILNHKL